MVLGGICGIDEDSLNNIMQIPQIGSTTRSSSQSAKKSRRMKERRAKSRLQVEINEDLVKMALSICTPSYIATHISTGSIYENENDGNGNTIPFTRRRISQRGIGTEEEEPIMSSNNQDEQLPNNSIDSQVAATTTQRIQLISHYALPQTTALEVLGESDLRKEDIFIDKAICC
jgi:hypothetical protein